MNSGVVAVAIALSLGSVVGMRAQPREQVAGDLETIQVRPNVYMVAGAGGNILVHVGWMGVILVDTGSVEMSDTVLAAISRISDLSKPHGEVIVKRALIIAALIASQSAIDAQGRGGAAQPPVTVRATAPIDLTGYWVAEITEDWRWRMVTPAYNLPLEGAHGGAETIYPEFRRKLRGIYTPPAQCTRYCCGAGGINVQASGLTCVEGGR